MNLKKRIRNQLIRPYLNKIDLSNRILEIGPLNAPSIEKADSKNVFYADIRSTEELKTHYKNRYSNICDIDYVIKESYAKSIKSTEKFDYIIANHVLEHIPQLIVFFLDIAEILNQGGKLCLAIPDKRLCFDRFRNPTSFAECYDVYKKNMNYSPMRILDYNLNYSLNDPLYWERKQHRFDLLISPVEELFNSAVDRYERANNGEPIDYPIHYHVFTPESFLILAYNMTNLSLFPFVVKEFYYTKPYMPEFCCILEVEKGLLEDRQKVSLQKNNIIKLLNKNSDSLLFSNSRKWMRRLLYIPYVLKQRIK
jgi:SAM-dependent methyltransferase